MRLIVAALACALVTSCTSDGAAPQPAAHLQPGALQAGCSGASCVHDVAYWREHPELWPGDDDGLFVVGSLGFWQEDLSCDAEQCGWRDAGWALVRERLAAGLNLQGLVDMSTPLDDVLQAADDYLFQCFTRGPCVLEEAPALTEALAAFNNGLTQLVGEPCLNQWECTAGTIACGEGGLACTDITSRVVEEICGNDLDDDCDGESDEGCACVPTNEVCGNHRDDDCDGLLDEGCGCVHSLAYWKDHPEEVPQEGINFQGFHFERDALACSAETCGHDARWELEAELLAAILNEPPLDAAIADDMLRAAHYLSYCPGQGDMCQTLADSVSSLRARLAQFNNEQVPERCGLGACTGVLVCTNQGFACHAEAFPVREVLGNGVDDDCDGRLDESCDPGTRDPEIVGNGVDDDCDGRVDELCDPTYGLEILHNGLDDNCNGRIDEGDYKTFFLNRFGATMERGNDDPIANRSSLGYAVDGRLTVPAFQSSDADWSQIMSCVRERFAAFDVAITDADPSPIPHVEAVIGGHGSLIRQNTQIGVAGVNGVGFGVVFVFAEYVREAYGDDALALICNAVAHEIGHTYNLDHVLLDEDVMSRVQIPNKSFHDADLPCSGDDHACNDGSATQNSFAILEAVLGRSSAPAP